MTANDFSVPVTERYFEDYVPGSVFEYGPISASEADIIAFAKQFDPQYIHTNPEAAAQGPFGGIIASGWYTASLMMRLFADHFLSKVAAIASPGVDELRWVRPVRPGDSLLIRIRITDARRSRSKPDRGVVHAQVEVLNQNREIVMTVKTMSMLRCRSAC